MRELWTGTAGYFKRTQKRQLNCKTKNTIDSHV